MSNAHYRTQETQQSQPQQHNPALAARRREVAGVMAEVGREFRARNGGAELEIAIDLLRTFAAEGKEYVVKLLKDATEEAEAARAERLKQQPRPDETKLPEGTEVRAKVKQARRARPIMDAASATRLCKLLIDLVRFRQHMEQHTDTMMEELFMGITEGRGFDSTLTKEEIGRKLREGMLLV